MNYEYEPNKSAKRRTLSAKERRAAKRYLAHYDPSMSYSEYSRIRGCEAKVRFPDLDSVIHAAIGHSAKHGPCRYYHCPNCKGYHLTSKVHGASFYEEDLAY